MLEWNREDLLNSVGYNLFHEPGIGLVQERICSQQTGLLQIIIFCHNGMDPYMEESAPQWIGLLQKKNCSLNELDF